MFGKKFVALSLLLLVAAQMNLVLSKPIFNNDFLNALNMHEWRTQLSNLLQPLNRGMTDISSMAQSMSVSSSAGGTKQDSAGASSLLKMFTP